MRRKRYGNWEHRLGSEHVREVMRAISDEGNAVMIWWWILRSRSKAPFVYMTAIDKLAARRHPRTVGILAHALEEMDLDISTRWEVIKALAAIGGDRAVRALTHELHHGLVAQEAADALAKIGTEPAVEALLGAMGHQHSHRRNAACTALYGNLRAIHSLLTALDDSEVAVRCNAMGGIGAILHENTLQSEGDLRDTIFKKAVQILNREGDESRVFVPQLLAALRSPDALRELGVYIERNRDVCRNRAVVSQARQCLENAFGVRLDEVSWWEFWDRNKNRVL